MYIADILSDLLTQQTTRYGWIFMVTSIAFSIILLAVGLNVLSQLLFRRPYEPPVVFHWFPIIGSTISYGIDPYKFYFDCRAKYGDIFTFILLGKKVTVYLGLQGNNFILNGKLKDVNAEEIYTNLTTPVFGRDVVYDCPNSKLMEQKKFMKTALTIEAFHSYVTIIQNEVEAYINNCVSFQGESGTVNISKVMAEITIYTASHALQGEEVRENFDSSFAALYHDLDMGFTPINFTFYWAPLPWNRARDHAQRTVARTYMNIIQARREEKRSGENKHDIMWELMRSTYKDGTPVPDREIAHMMIALLMAGQHSSSSTSSWIMLWLAARPDIMEELYEEQLRIFGSEKPFPPLQYEDLSKLQLHQNVLKEVLRLHAPIHSIMRKVKNPMIVPGTKYVIPTSHVLISSPGCTSQDATFFPDPLKWDPHRWDIGSGKVLGNDAVDEKYDYGYGLTSTGASSPYLPFGAGRHRCIGEQFATLQLVTIMATMVRFFRFRNIDGKQGVVKTDYSSLFSMPLAPALIGWEKR
uniref:Eburicol 14-alpha-demethylase n=3 Tax=Uncinula necator TaxID=52586 RepID=CP51_UNCNE|nr:RecName: Full=Eburicol 14-alpha-demethylase; AltName: Full=CYPLI; AltName: Full=Cytochrome P450 51; AltName: Full=Cytochrome P450-14DM; AltName: Full=Cytochrome P450-LIA1; AltName: Full=Sterol 14-alpha demethylase [Erysiphe necator]AAC49811.2 eburicol C14-alpha-demethylase [Erysiphe necator]AAC49812.2 eburicol 14-alpha-demethylase [Erysiphe necator]ABR53729.1 cytochrome P450 sterol 14-alpha demethylase [Erysiphe necator]AIT52080.1 cytochrome P450 sterol 14-alpha demethylase [Erysiphe necator